MRCHECWTGKDLDGGCHTFVSFLKDQTLSGGTACCQEKHGVESSISVEKNDERKKDA